jgi:D-alanyl-D-alanine carboxypeptidase/D-alanyl-D-alanine-endopeptidase (penicillin-binding protein 4)
MPSARRARSTYPLVGVTVLAVVVAAVVVAVFTANRHDTNAETIPEPPAATADPGVVPVAETAPTPSAQGLAAAMAAVVADPDLGSLSGRITDAATGSRLWAQADDAPMLPASTNKVLTSASALLTLDRGARVTTRVVAGDRPGEVVLVGGGDPTLSAVPPGRDSWYRGAARIGDLAAQVRRSGIAATSLQVDTAAFSGPTMAPGWDPLDIDGGDIAPIESVMLDGGRTQPATLDSRRSTTPALDAGHALARALGIDAGRVGLTRAPAGARELASVRSAPLSQRLVEMMNDSDNVMAECIAREVAAALHRPQSFRGAVAAVTSQLSAANVETDGAELVDSSGLSIDDRLTAGILDAVVQAAAGPGQPALRPLLDVLPIAGGSGTLSDRFQNPVTDRGAAGWLRAKTGSLDRTNALAGVVTDRDGRVLTFGFISNDAGPTGRTAIDALAATLRSCGCR